MAAYNKVCMALRPNTNWYWPSVGTPSSLGAVSMFYGMFSTPSTGGLGAPLALEPIGLSSESPTKNLSNFACILEKHVQLPSLTRQERLQH